MAKRFVVRASQGRGWRNNQRLRSSRHCSSLAWGSESRSRQVTNTKRLPSCQWGRWFRQTSKTPGPSSEQPELAVRRFFESKGTYFPTILSLNRRKEGRFSYRPCHAHETATGERVLLAPSRKEQFPISQSRFLQVPADVRRPQEGRFSYRPCHAHGSATGKRVLLAPSRKGEIPNRLFAVSWPTPRSSGWSNEPKIPSRI